MNTLIKIAVEQAFTRIKHLMYGYQCTKACSLDNC